MTQDRFLFGLTLAQVDELGRLIGLITAYGDVLAMSEVRILHDQTVSTIGHAVFRAGLDVRGILEQLDEQRLQERLGKPLTAAEQESD